MQAIFSTPRPIPAREFGHSQIPRVLLLPHAAQPHTARRWPRRLLKRHLEFLARGAESVGAPLVSTPLPLPYSIAANGPSYRARSSRIKLAADTIFLKLIPFAPILIDRWASAHILGAQGHTSAGAQVLARCLFTSFPRVTRPMYPPPSALRYTPSSQRQETICHPSFFA